VNVKNTKTCAALALLTALLGACSSTPVATPAVAQTPATPAPAPSTPNRTASGAAATPAPAPVSQVATVTLPAYLDPKSEISTGRSVYFDFDAASLKPEFSTLIERQGKYLMANPKLAIRIEGNTDERGSAEYNLALGQKRAESVRQALKVYGVKDTQIEAVSWGEEKPKAKGHDESDWAQNRRADVQYPSK
jgi:peptidoglycan-associated lipoprotein